MFFSSKGPKWLLVFLGNPGAHYRDTRHNVGFMAAERLAKQQGVSIKRLKYSALTAVLTLEGQKVMLMLPQLYMNRSGHSVYPAARFYKIPPERIVVVTDDTAMEAGRLRIRRRGSAGGHNGLKSIIMALGSEDFPRIKIGVGAPPHPAYEMADWVLGTPQGAEKQAVDAAVDQAVLAVEEILRNGVEAAMNRFN